MLIGIFYSQIVESSSLVFREAISHPYISFFHLLVFIIIIIIISFFRQVFSEYTEANNVSLIPLDTILLEKCAFIIGFSSTVWTKMRSLAGSLANGVLADAIFILGISDYSPKTS